MQPEIGIEPHLKEAVQLTGANWAVLAERVGGVWLVRSSYHLNKTAQNELTGMMAGASTDAWLCGALTGGHTRSAEIGENRGLGAGRFFAYPILNSSQLILVGAEEQTSDAQRIWRLAASLFSSQSAPKVQPLLPDLQSGLAFDLPVALEKVLGNFVQSTPCQGAWLAIRRGDTLDIQAEWNASKARGESMVIDDNPIFRRVNRSLADLLLTRGQPNFDQLPFMNLKPSGGAWICLPLVVGQRLIGIVAMWRQKDFSAVERGQLRELALSVPQTVDIVVTFSEMSSHLRRLGLLNDFVLTVSSAQNLDQIARRMFGLLSRAFATELIALFLRSSDGRILRDYRIHEGKLNVISVSLTDHPIQPLLREGRVRRVSDSSREGFVGLNKSARSELIVPLRYRGQATGVLILENTQAEAFSQYDEHLMVVIASHLAGLIEYTRLREEAEGRARSLGLIHEVVQQVIGLNDKKEVASITAELVAQYFRYELAAILLLDNRNEFSIQGIGGTQAKSFTESLGREDFVALDGVTGHVLRKGESVLLNDTSQSRLYKPTKGWEARSEICVAVKDGGQILGIIDVESRELNAFSHNDLIAMEALAGILASVVTSANQYQRLQETVHQLQITEMELKDRMEAQRAAENRLLQTAKLAAVGEMAASVAHELNNPLTTVTGFSELVLEDLPEDSPHKKELLMVLKEARRASSVVRRLLDFSRQGERVRASADLNEVVNDVIALTRHLVQTNKVALIVEPDVALPWVSIDSNQMKQVLLNLIHNGLQAMPRGGEMQVRTFLGKRENRDWVVMSVKDSGMGISIEDQLKIFEPFFTTKSSSGGTGLGLSVTYGIVADHGGTIEVFSQPGQGSVFEVWLPL